MDLSTLQKTMTRRPPRLVVYGPQGTGKSTFASQAPGVVFMDIENGLDGIESVKQRVETWKDVIDMLNALRDQPHQFETLAIDSADWLERIIHSAVATANKVSTISDIGYSRGYEQALDYWKVLTEKLTGLRETRNMCSIVIAHEKVRRFDDPMGPGYDTYSLALHKSSAPYLLEWADGVLFMKSKTAISTEKGGFTGEIRKATSIGTYMHTKESPAYTAKNRKSLSLPAEFPVSRDNSWGDFIAQIGKGI